MLSDGELTTLLAALRLWQQQMSTLGPESQQSLPLLGDIQPLSAAEIDQLCARVNVELHTLAPVETGSFVLCLFDSD